MRLFSEYPSYGHAHAGQQRRSGSFSDFLDYQLPKFRNFLRGTPGQRRHEEKQKPYQWTLCEVEFSEAGNLMGHMRTHTGEKPYHCTLCDVQFSEAGHLKLHMRTHTDTH